MAGELGMYTLFAEMQNIIGPMLEKLQPDKINYEVGDKHEFTINFSFPYPENIDIVDLNKLDVNQLQILFGVATLLLDAIEENFPKIVKFFNEGQQPHDIRTGDVEPGLLN